MAKPRTDFEPTPDERKNGWTAEKLAAYMREREQQTIAHATHQAERGGNPLRVQSTKTYDPHRW